MMRNLVALAFAAILIILSDAEKCRVVDPSKMLRISIRTKRNDTGNWITKFTARGGAESIEDGMALNISQNIVSCGGVEFMEIEGYLVTEVDSERTAKHRILKVNKTEEEVVLARKEVVEEESYHRNTQPLHFHERTGVNIVLSNNKRTAARKNYEATYGYGSMITNRPLKDNELFEVQLDEITTKYGNSLSLGVTVLNPTTVSFKDNWFQFKDGVWVYSWHNIWKNGNIIQRGYGIDLKRLQVGDRVGVMRKSNGSLHFFVNGADQGAIKTKVPEEVYGVMDLWGGPVQATIVNVNNC